MFEFRHLYCEYAELHAPSSSGLDELLIAFSAFLAIVTALLCKWILNNVQVYQLIYFYNIANGKILVGSHIL